MLVVPTRDTAESALDPIAETCRQWDAHGWPEAAKLGAVLSIVRSHQILLAEVDRALRPFDLTLARFSILALLHFSKRGELPLGKIASRLQVHATSVSKTVSHLERQGLVRRIPHPEDRRATLAELTPAGRDVVLEAKLTLDEAVRSLTVFGAGDSEALFEILLRFRRAVGDFVVSDEATPAFEAELHG
jgi:DNA-binding MarR family transcriptional regulator